MDEPEREVRRDLLEMALAPWMTRIRHETVLVRRGSLEDVFLRLTGRTLEE